MAKKTVPAYGRCEAYTEAGTRCKNQGVPKRSRYSSKYYYLCNKHTVASKRSKD